MGCLIAARTLKYFYETKTQDNLGIFSRKDVEPSEKHMK